MTMPFIIFIFGLIIGSFLNCLIWRLYKEESLGGRSYCPACRKTIAWYDNIPLVSFILLAGRCRNCKGKISWQYPLVELVTAILFLLVYLNNAIVDYSLLAFLSQSADFYWQLARDYVIIATLLIVLVYDLRWYLISNLVILPALVLVFVFNVILGYSWLTLLFFAALSSGFFLLQFIITRRRGIGEGDIWLGLLLGVVFPYLPSWWLMIVLAYLLGSLVGLILMIQKKKKWSSKLPLGVFLAASAIIVLIYGQPILDYYFAFFQ